MHDSSHVMDLHGHPVTYRLLGDGPPLLLLHGITSSSETWEPVSQSMSTTTMPLSIPITATPASPGAVT